MLNKVKIPQNKQELRSTIMSRAITSFIALIALCIVLIYYAFICGKMIESDKALVQLYHMNIKSELSDEGIFSIDQIIIIKFRDGWDWKEFGIIDQYYTIGKPVSEDVISSGTLETVKIKKKLIKEKSK